MSIKKLLLSVSSLAVVMPLYAASPRVLDIQHWSTNNGARVYFVPAHNLPMVDINVAFYAGSSRDGAQPGIAALTNELLDQGAGNYSADQIAMGFDQVGAQYNDVCARDMAAVSLRSLVDKQQLQPALTLFATILSKPTFDAVSFERQRRMQLTALMQQDQSPTNVANEAFYREIYPLHPYGNPILGARESVAAFKASDVAAFFNRFYVAKNAVIAIVGDVDETQAHQIAEEITQSMATGARAPALDAVAPLKQPVVKQINFPASQTNIRIGQPGISRNSPDYFTLLVGNYSLGGGTLVSRLMDEVREKRGLSYNVYSAFIPMAEKGPFLVSLGTRNQQAHRALEIARQTLRNFVETGPTQLELKAAKQNLTGGFALRLDSNKAISDNLLLIGFYDLPLDYLDTYRDNLNQVTQQSVKAAFQKHLQLNNLVTVSVGGKA